jgi:hypothetical protein
MKLTKSKLKEIIREELLKESRPIPELEYSFSKTPDFRKAVKAVYKIENALYDKFLAHVKKIPIHKWTSFRKDVNKLLKTYRIRETIKLQKINRGF